MRSFESYWTVRDSAAGMVKEKRKGPLIVNYGGETNGTHIVTNGAESKKVFPFFQDEEEGYYALVPDIFDGENTEMWIDLEEQVIYTVANEALVDVLVRNLVFQKLKLPPPPQAPPNRA